MNIEDFKEQYNKVFDTEGTIKLCGREETKKLIRLAKELKPDVDFGNESTGFLNIDNIKSVHISV